VAVHRTLKDVRSQGGCPLRTRGFFRCGRANFLFRKT